MITINNIPWIKIKEQYRKNTNFDTPDKLEISMLERDLIALNNGQTITKPIFDFPTNRYCDTESVVPTEKGKKTLKASIRGKRRKICINMDYLAQVIGSLSKI